MKAERKDGKFILEMNLAELNTLFCLIEEERVSVSISVFKFREPKKIKKILQDFHKKVFSLMEMRTAEEKEAPLFKEGPGDPYPDSFAR